MTSCLITYIFRHKHGVLVRLIPQLHAASYGQRSLSEILTRYYFPLHKTLFSYNIKKEGNDLFILHMCHWMGNSIKDSTWSSDLWSGSPCPSPYWYWHSEIRARFTAVSTKCFSGKEESPRPSRWWWSAASSFIFFQVSSIISRKYLRVHSSACSFWCVLQEIQFAVSPLSIFACKSQ